MRNYLLTNQEREIIKKFLETGERPEGYRMLLSRCRHMQPINKDLQLIEQFLKKNRKIGDKHAFQKTSTSESHGWLKNSNKAFEHPNL